MITLPSVARSGLLNFYVVWAALEKLGLQGKATPLQAWTGPEGSRRLRLPDFKTVST